MMWKNTDRIGVERIDQQHMELFRMTEELLNAVKSGTAAEVYRKALGFLKDYVIYHFRDEEAYQESIGYSGIQAHKEEHRQFTKTVLDYEKRLTESGFDEKIMKDLVGTVTAWLIYHVVDTDQKIVSGETAAAEESRHGEYAELFAYNAMDVMATMAGLDGSGTQLRTVAPYQSAGDVFVSIQLIHDLQAEVVFGFSKELALRLLGCMTGMELTEVDELVQSALCELTNISCGNAATALSQRGMQCDIKPPMPSREFVSAGKGSGVLVDTAFGRLSVGVLQ